MSEEGAFESWVILEQMGHKKLAGYAREVVVAGHGFIRIDIPSATDPAKWEATQLISPASGSIYALTPVSEDVARAVAKGNRIEPVSRWELPQIEDRRNGTSPIVCPVVIEDGGLPRQCGERAEWDGEVCGFRCEAHEGRNEHDPS